MAETRSDSRRPMCCQVLPPSVDLYTPSPNETLLRVFDSPVPTQITSGLLGASAMSPIEMVPCRSKIGFQVTPPFVVFQRPPEAVATNTILALPGRLSMSAI